MPELLGSLGQQRTGLQFETLDALLHGLNEHSLFLEVAFLHSFETNRELLQTALETLGLDQSSQVLSVLLERTLMD